MVSDVSIPVENLGEIQWTRTYEERITLVHHGTAIKLLCEPPQKKNSVVKRSLAVYWLFIIAFFVLILFRVEDYTILLSPVSIPFVIFVVIGIVHCFSFDRKKPSTEIYMRDTGLLYRFFHKSSCKMEKHIPLKEIDRFAVHNSRFGTYLCAYSADMLIHTFGNGNPIEKQDYRARQLITFVHPEEAFAVSCIFQILLGHLKTQTTKNRITGGPSTENQLTYTPS